MRHLGDITKINWFEVEPVDCVTGGSPCQDLSVAGKRAGLAGERSGLYMEQIRCIKELRQRDIQSGRTGAMVRPRWMVWENVPGAFSSNEGRDFAAVLEEAVKIVEPQAPPIPVPDKGWPSAGCLSDVDGKWSIAWRVHDAQFWGVPQRRKRIALVCDFGGHTAPEILFERKGLRGDTAEGGTAREGIAGAAEAGFNSAIARSLTARADGSPCADRGPNIVCSPNQGGCDGGGKGALVQTEKSGTLGTGNDQTIFQGCITPWDCQSKRIFGTSGEAPTLQGGIGGGVNNPAIFCLATQQGGAELRTDDRAPTLTAAAGMSGNNQPVVAIPINDKATRWQGGGESSNHDGSGNGLGIGKEGDPSPTLTAGDRHGVMCMTPWDAQSQRVYDGNGVSPTLSSRENSGLNREAVLCAGFKLGNSEQARSIGYAEEQAPTLNAECGGNKPAVMCLNDQGGNVMGVSHDVSGTMRAQEHGHQPTILDMSHACDVIRDCGEVSTALQARMGTGGNQVPMTYQMQGFGDYREGNVASSCKQRDFKDGTDLAITNMAVRRLTPMECERLQGFPDGWTDIGEWIDEEGRTHKQADSPRYKALGNSIALPFWHWMFCRMAEHLPGKATLGSLFDGIGGFPLCWENIHGKGTARWASEIEKFPIAVTKLRFPEES